MIMIALVFGNALKEQKHYEDRVATTLFDDIQKITSTKSEDHVIMNGNISYAPSIRQAIRRYRILRSLVSINFRTDRDDGAYIHNKLRYYGLDKPRPCNDVSLNALCKKIALYPEHQDLLTPNCIFLVQIEMYLQPVRSAMLSSGLG